MANLETLFIEIDGSAQKASTGIDTLIGSISNLGKIVSSQAGAVRDYAKAIGKIAKASAGGNAFKNVSSQKFMDGVKKGTGAMNKYAGGMRDVASVTEQARDSIAGTSSNFKGFADEASKASNKTTQFADAQKEVAATTKTLTAHVGKSRGAFSSLFSTFGRLAKMMILRMAIKALIKVAQQGLKNYYDYSKKINGTFYSASQELQTSLATTGNQMGAMIGTLITAIAPLLLNLLQIINKVAEALTMLFALLSGSTTYSRAVAVGIDDIGNSASGASGKMKELLASFDELNVIASESGGGGGSSNGFDFGGTFEEVPLPEWMITYKDWIIGGLLAAAIAGIVTKLSDLWGWLKKIKDIGGTTNLKMPTQPHYEPFPTQPVYTDFPAPKSYATMAGEWQLISGGMNGAATGAELLDEALKKVSGTLAGISMITGIISTLSSLLSSLAKSINVTTNVDSSKFDEFKKNLEEYCKTPKVVNVNIEDATARDLLAGDLSVSIPIYWQEPEYTLFTSETRKISNFINTASNKVVGIWFDDTQYEVFWIDAYSVYDFITGKHNKKVGIAFDETQYNVFWISAYSVYDYIYGKHDKVVGIAFNETQYNLFWQYAYAIYDYIYGKHNKVVGIEFDGKQYVTFWENANSIYTWVYKNDTKIIGIKFNTLEHITFLSEANAIKTFVNTPHVKAVGIRFDPIDYTTYKTKENALLAFIATNHTKKVGIGFVTNEYNTYKQQEVNFKSFIATNHKKVVGIKFNAEQLVEYWKQENTILRYVWATYEQVIGIGFNTSQLKLFTARELAIIAWSSVALDKNINIVFGNISSVNSVTAALDAWAKTTLNKTINVVVKVSTKTVSTSVVADALFDGVLPTMGSTVQSSLTDKIQSSFYNLINNYQLTSDAYTVPTSTGGVGAILEGMVNTTMKAIDAVVDGVNETSNMIGGAAVDIAVNSGMLDAMGDIVKWITGGYATGAYGIPSGDLFIANEAGAELVGSMGGHTTVANQQQIIEGIRSGVESANEQQNALLRQQNELLRGILEKESVVRFGSSAALGRVAKQSIDMYSNMIGG